MENQKLARSILKNIEYATLATVNESGEPWNTPVYCASDENFNIYWSSSPESIHSKNISSNGKVFIVIYNSKAKTGEGQGVYLQTTAQELKSDDEIKLALALLGERRGRPFVDISKFKETGPQRIFKATPSKVWINDADQDDEGDFIKDYRIEITL